MHQVLGWWWLEGDIWEDCRESLGEEGKGLDNRKTVLWSSKEVSYYNSCGDLSTVAFWRLIKTVNIWQTTEALKPDQTFCPSGHESYFWMLEKVVLKKSWTQSNNTLREDPFWIWLGKVIPSIHDAFSTTIKVVQWLILYVLFSARCYCRLPQTEKCILQ